MWWKWKGAGIAHSSPSLPEMTCGFLINVVFCQEKNNNNKYETKLKSFLSVAPLSKKNQNPGSTPGHEVMNMRMRNELLSAG